jgi:hypothetical protein
MDRPRPFIRHITIFSMGWLKTLLACALILAIASGASADSPIVNCSVSFGDEVGQAYSPKDPLYLDLPATIGLQDVAKVTLYINDPAVRKEAKAYTFSGNAYEDVYTSKGPIQESTSGYQRSLIPYDGAQSITLGFRNKYDYEGPMQVMVVFYALRPYPDGKDYQESGAGATNPASPWYHWYCSESEEHPVVCGAQKSCKICYKQVGLLVRQYWSVQRKAQATPPGGYDFTPWKDNPTSQWQSYSFSDPNHQVAVTGPDGKTYQSTCPLSFEVEAGPKSIRWLPDATMFEWQKKQGAKVSETSGPGGMAEGKSFEVLSGEAASDVKCKDGCDRPRSMSIGYEISSEMAPRGSGVMYMKATKQVCTTPDKLKSETDKMKAETKAYMASYKLTASSQPQFKPKTCANPPPKTQASGMLSGRITDGHTHPMAYMKLTLDVGGQQYSGYTDDAGNFQFADVKGLKPDASNPPEANLKAEFTYFRDGKYYMRVVDDSSSGKVVEYERTFKLRGDSDLTQDVDYMIDAPEGKTEMSADGVTVKSTSRLRDLRDLAPIYAHISQAIDFALVALKANIDYKLPVDVYVGGEESVYYSRPSSSIAIGAKEASYGSMHRPDNREYHEFSHHIMFSQWNGDTIKLPVDKNHGGFVNSNTADSYTEGFAEFMAMAIADRVHDPANWPPEVYGGYGSYEENIKVWERFGKSEERAVCGVLWDLYDGADPADNDTVSIPLDEMWPILKVKRPTFYEYYKAFRDANPGKAAGIDQIMVNHGIFADNNTGNRRCDPFEPWITDKNGNHVCDAGDKWIDYGANSTAGIGWDPNEALGKATNYERQTRSMAGYIPDAFVRVADERVHYYLVKVDYPGPAKADYEYRTEAREGKVYLAPLPEGADATVTMTADSQDYKADAAYKITAKEYDKEYYAAKRDQGYFASHDFKLKATGLKKDPKYETFHNAKPVWDSDGGYDVIDEHKSPNQNAGEGEGKPSCSCLPLLPLILAGMSSAAAKASGIL